jgi:hypothetical protein
MNKFDDPIENLFKKRAPEAAASVAGWACDTTAVKSHHSLEPDAGHEGAQLRSTSWAWKVTTS